MGVCVLGGGRARVRACARRAWRARVQTQDPLPPLPCTPRALHPQASTLLLSNLALETLLLLATHHGAAEQLARSAAACRRLLHLSVQGPGHATAAPLAGPARPQRTRAPLCAGAHS